MLARQHRCTNCDYDLTGNVSGICPEYGMPPPMQHQLKMQHDVASIAGDGCEA
jgi:hypothetical protein